MDGAIDEHVVREIHTVLGLDDGLMFGTRSLRLRFGCLLVHSRMNFERCPMDRDRVEGDDDDGARRPRALLFMEKALPAPECHQLFTVLRAFPGTQLDCGDGGAQVLPYNIKPPWTLDREVTKHICSMAFLKSSQ